jgi:hypothetical protein
VAAVALVGLVGTAARATSSSPAGLTALPALAQLQAAIRSAAAGGPLPSALVARLPDEAGSTFAGDPCQQSPGDAPVARECTFGDPAAATTVVLDGDSFALEWVPALDQLGRADHFRVEVFARYGCPFASIAVTDWLGSVDPGCATFRTAVLAAIAAQRPAPSLVLLAEETQHASGDPSHPALSAHQWAGAVSATLGQLSGVAAPVAVVLGEPRAAQDPGTCLASSLLDYAACATPVAAAYPNQWYPLIARTAHHAGDAVVDVASLVCRRRCPDVIGGQLVYADRWHLGAGFVGSVPAALGELIGCAGEPAHGVKASGALFESLLGEPVAPDVLRACRRAASWPSPS